MVEAKVNIQERPGYKHTKLGWIPEDWEFAPLDSVTPNGKKYGIVDGPFGSNLKTIHYRSSGIPIITSGYVTDGAFYADEYLFVEQELYDREKRSSVKGGDIVMAKIGARCGASAILPDDHETGILSGNALKISVDEARHSNFYVWSWLWHLYQTGKIELLKTVGAQPAISMSSLKKYKLPLPPLPEQQKIAQILRTWDKAITKTEQLIAKKQERKKGLMQHLLTGKKRFKEFEDEKLRQLEIGNVIKFSGGSQPPRSTFRFEEQEGFIRLVQNRDYKSDKYKTYIPEKLAKKHCDETDIMIGRYGPPLFQIFRGIKGAYNVALIKAIPDESQLLKEYCWYFINRPELQKYIDGFSQRSGGQTGIEMDRLNAFPLPLPSLEEQQRITSVLSSADQEIASFQNQLTKLKEQKKGLMQKLLTGEVRVKID